MAARWEYFAHYGDIDAFGKFGGGTQSCHSRTDDDHIVMDAQFTCLL
jgi:hypothetical protein